jgi:ABC-type sugar transport system substrate-binding protein
MPSSAPIPGSYLFCRIADRSSGDATSSIYFRTMPPRIAEITRERLQDRLAAGQARPPATSRVLDACYVIGVRYVRKPPDGSVGCDAVRNKRDVVQGMPMTQIKRLALFLTRKDEAQLAWAATVRDAARINDLHVTEHWIDDPAEQNHIIAESIFNKTTDALLILPASASGPAALLSQAAARDISIILLDRVTHDLDFGVSWSLPRLRREHPRVLSVRIAPDEQEIGRIQGRQTLALLPAGGSVLCVQGDTRTSAVEGRKKGLEEMLRHRSEYSLGKVDGGWNADRAATVVEEWLRFVLQDSSYRLNLVVTQSEVMLDGIRRGLELLARELSRSELSSVPMIGCDGMPTFKLQVDEGRLAATVEIPSRTETAMQILLDFSRRGVFPPKPDLSLAPGSYPSLDQLSSRLSS